MAKAACCTSDTKEMDKLEKKWYFEEVQVMQLHFKKC